MLISEVMLLGSMLAPQGYGATGLWGEKRCAFGAVFNALGLSPPNRQAGDTLAYDDLSPITLRWPWLKAPSSCPAGCLTMHPKYPMASTSYAAVVVHLNDIHRWSISKITMWLSMYEPKETSVGTTSTPSTESANIAAIRQGDRGLCGHD